VQFLRRGDVQAEILRDGACSGNGSAITIRCNACSSRLSVASCYSLLEFHEIEVQSDRVQYEEIVREGSL
jgi:hypothetical protein